MLNAAVDDGVILANPAGSIGRQLRLGATKADREEVNAMTRYELTQFLASAAEIRSPYYVLFFALARMGLRLGEALALQWASLDLAS